MKLYLRYLNILLKSQLQYRISFILICIGQFFAPLFAFVGLYLLFERFGTIKGWSFFEVALCFAIIQMSFSISETFVRGFDSFSSLVINGDFDRILVRPRSTVMQVLGSKLDFSRLGRLLQSVVVLIWAAANISIQWNVFKIVTLILMLISGVFIFSGIFIFSATLCFWTTQGLEVINIITDGGREIAQYPLNIYKKWITRFFTFIIPLGCVNYLPLMYLLDRAGGNQVLYILTPLYGIIFMVPCLLIWRFGVRHYRSTGS